MDTSTSTPRRILLVEDDPDIRYEVASLFRHAGFEVREQSNGRKALEALVQSTAPDLIVLDLRLPEMDGWAFRAEQKKRPALADIPVVAISADPSSKAAAIDAARFLQKPFSVDELLDAVNDVVYERERQRSVEAGLLDEASVTPRADSGLAFVVARDPQLRARFAARLADAGLRVHEVESARRVLASVERPDTVLVQVDPGSTQDHRQSSRLVHGLRGVPVVVAVGDANGLVAIEHWRDGVCRQLDGPFDGAVLASEMAAASARKVASEILARENAELRSLAAVDTLTGLFNRRFMMHRLQQTRVSARRSNSPFAVVMADLDDFKERNDRFGHAVGDAVLLRVARTLAQHVREADLLGRWGGDEFLLILPSTDTDAALAVAERLQAGLRAAPTPVDLGGPITACLGVCAVHPRHTLAGERLIELADQALYSAKRQGPGSLALQQAKG